mmetsp:Transcript_21011/g.43932  ORF Transcript_21011/g.43932 Transcript_21011/m.43932 type:complete len:205 (-) Transcript_21011:596-1210(-)
MAYRQACQPHPVRPSCVAALAFVAWEWTCRAWHSFVPFDGEPQPPWGWSFCSCGSWRPFALVGDCVDYSCVVAVAERPSQIPFPCRPCQFRWHPTWTCQQPHRRGTVVVPWRNERLPLPCLATFVRNRIDLVRRKALGWVGYHAPVVVGQTCHRSHREHYQHLLPRDHCPNPGTWTVPVRRLLARRGCEWSWDEQPQRPWRDRQ